MGDGDQEEAVRLSNQRVLADKANHGRFSPVRIIRHPGQRIIPRHERRQKPKEPSGFDDGWVRHALFVAMQVADAEQHKGEV